MNKNLPITVQSPQEQAAELSLQKLTKSWLRRQRWKNYLSFKTKISGEQTTSTWRTKLADSLDSKRVHIIVIALLIVDITLTTLELTSSVLSCNASEHAKREHEGHERWFHWFGIAILCVLLARAVALVVALAGRALMRKPGVVVDGVVLAVALVLEAFFRKKGGGIVVVVSLWRVVRVLESVFELSNDAIEAQIKAITAQLKGLSEENMRLLQVIDEKSKIIEKLQKDFESV